jgi:PEP-CTERM motif-containing protein
MRRVVVLAILALLVVSVAAWADTITIGNRGGNIAISAAGIVSTSSHLHQFNNIIAPPGQGLGFVNFNTGALTSGSIDAGGTFSSVGSSFLVRSTSALLPCHNCIIFSGAFTGDITWTFVGQQGKKLIYQMTGNLVGQLFNGRTITGQTTQNFYAFAGQLKQGVGHITIGDTTLGTPEPGTLSLLGTGLIGMAGFIRRKLIA